MLKCLITICVSFFVLINNKGNTEQGNQRTYADTSWKHAAYFSLPDSSGKFCNLKDFKGKVVVLDFWFTGCGACQIVKPLVERVEKKYENKPVVFISISGDKDKEVWKMSLKKGNYTFENSIKVYTNGERFLHPTLLNYNVYKFPTLIVINTNRMVYKEAIDPRLDSMRSINLLISDCLSDIEKTSQH